MAVYALNKVTVDFGGVRVDGFGETDAFSYKRTADRWDVVACCDGGAVANRIHSALGEMTFTLRYNSPAHRVIAQAANAGSSVAVCVTLENGRVIESGDARVLKDPEPSFGAKTGDEVWTLVCNPITVTYEVGGA